jgi:HPt (histidine-containing phosphotransfer) domain-containing protein
VSSESQGERIVEGLVEWGCDVPGALKRCMGHDDLYVKLLLTVPDEAAFANLGVALKNKDPKAAFDAAHEIKGVVANMGLTPLYDDAVAIVEPLRAGKFINTDENYAKLLADLETLKKIIKG